MSKPIESASCATTAGFQNRRVRPLRHPTEQAENRATVGVLADASDESVAPTWPAATVSATAAATQGAKVASRFWLRVDRSGGDAACWVWTGTIAGKGYGYITIAGKKRRAHRVAYELAHGAINDDMVIDHVKSRGCTNRLCVNPAHLEAVTNRENVLRGEHPNAIAHRSNTCMRGHSLADARRRKNGRECRTCFNMRERSRRAAKRQAVSA